MDYSNLTKKELITIIEQSRKKESDKHRDLFLSNISHDVRTLLNAIYGNAQILDNDNTLSMDNKKSVKKIINATSHMIDLINNIITLSKNSGNDKIILSQFNLKELLLNIYSIFKNLASSKGLDFELNTNINKEYILKSDKNKLFYILLNLVGNAVKFTNRGFVSINCNISENKDSIIFEIKDSGSGINESDIINLSNEYVRGENSKDIDGFGLGLGIVNKNLTLLESELNISSKLNKGSEFSFSIKCQKNTKTFVSTQEDIFEIQEIKSIKDSDSLIPIIYSCRKENISILDTYFSTRNIKYKEINNIDKLKGIELNDINNMIFIDIDNINSEEINYLAKLKDENKDISIIALTSLVMARDLANINKISTTYIVEPYSFIDIDQVLIMFSSSEYDFVKKEPTDTSFNIKIEEELKNSLVLESNLGNYKVCNKLIGQIVDNKTKEYLLDYLEEYEFDKIVDILSEKKSEI
ncbi:sensor histidine kinase [Poseidonibacter lekithochrous]|uniref:sensor histidine kinase n=1 Tax=Poseidonibacter lekithochrous TaxID=1904463 RepID=UPI0008FCC8DE|nr:HAMP domain-containing sensor histidine kinase [Poseidonibacter lekithochrous]QKJ23593.1 two-component system sensor histidine kinase [Poseidonibacter lekithochrous]